MARGPALRAHLRPEAQPSQYEAGVLRTAGVLLHPRLPGARGVVSPSWEQGRFVRARFEIARTFSCTVLVQLVLLRGRAGAVRACGSWCERGAARSPLVRAGMVGMQPGGEIEGVGY